MKFTLSQDLTPSQWPALPRAFKTGEVLHKFTGHDYGCARDDMMYGGHETIACSLDGETPFFTVPVKYLRTESGEQVMGDYVFAR